MGHLSVLKRDAGSVATRGVAFVTTVEMVARFGLVLFEQYRDCSDLLDGRICNLCQLVCFALCIS